MIPNEGNESKAGGKRNGAATPYTYQHEDLDEDSAGRGRRILAEADGFQARPGESVGVQQVRKELGDVPQLVGLQPADVKGL